MTEDARSSRDPEVRRARVAALSREEPARVASEVLRALGDEDWRVRKEAVAVATAIGARHELGPQLVLAITQEDNVGLRSAAIEVAAALGTRVVGTLSLAIDPAPAVTKKFLVEALGRAGGRDVAPRLAALCRSGDSDVVAAAMDALAATGGEEAEAVLLACLASADPIQRMGALDGLDRLDAHVTWDRLAPLLSDALVRRVAIPALGRSGDRRAIAPLVEALRERSKHVVATAAVALGRLAADGALAPLVEDALRGVTSEVRATLVKLLNAGDLDTRRATAHLLLLAREPAAVDGVVCLVASEGLAPAAGDALAAWGSPLVPALLSAHGRLREEPSAVALELAADLAGAPRAHADEALRAAVRAALRAALASGRASSTHAAVRCLGAWGEAADAATLVALAVGGDARLAQACEASLVDLSVRHLEAVRDAIRGTPFDGAAVAALTTVSVRVGAEGAVERLQAAMSADDPATRCAAIEALAALGGDETADQIALALADEDLDVQLAAARALGGPVLAREGSLAENALMVALEVGVDAVVAEAARALGAAGIRSAAPALRARLRAGDAGVAVAAMEALRRLRDSALGDLLVEALGQADTEVVKQALHAISEGPEARRALRLSVGLSHPSWDVRQLAARLLGTRGAGGDLGAEAREALEARRAAETDDLVLAAIEAALAGDGGSEA